VPVALGSLLLVVAQVVFAAAPTGTFEISDNTPTIGQTVTFTPQNVNDPDGGTTSVSFDYGDGTTDSEAPFTHVYNDADPAQKTVTMTITAQPGPSEDPASPPETTPVTRNVTVSQANQPPTADFTIAPNPAQVGQTVTFTGSANDPDGPPIRDSDYDWDLDPNNPGFERTGNTVTYSYATAGARAVTLQVTDSSGAKTVVDPPKTVTINDNPQADFKIEAQNRLLDQLGDPALDQVPSVPLVDQSIKLDGTASSAPGGTITKYEWARDIDNDGTFESAIGSGETFTIAPGLLPPGNMSVKLTVTDSSNVTAEKTLPLRVNRRPESNFVVEPVTPVINQSITFSSAATDQDVAEGHGDSLTHAWAIDRNRNGTFEASENAGTASSITASFTTAGTYPVRLRVKDSGGIAAEHVRNVLVQNTIPKGGFTWSPNSPLPGEAVVFSGSPSVATAGKSITGYEWDFDFDPSKDQFDVDAAGASVPRSFPTAGTKTVALRVTETGGGFAIVFDRIVVNAPPQAAFTVAPGSPFTGDVVTYSSTSVDSDGPLAQHEWDLDGDGAYDDATGPVVSASYKKRGTYNVGLRVTDSKGATATSARQVTVAQRPLAVLTGVLVEIRGRLEGARTRLTRLLVRAPRGSLVTVKCKGKPCPKKARRKAKPTTALLIQRKGLGRKKLRIKRLERSLRPGTKVIVTVTKAGFIGKRTTFTMMRGRQPLRRDLCLVPGARKAIHCPGA
jgi:PKD repeat protein